ncbi:hypothetical protein O6H91_Y322300 [Diphasiastrum complanatum]|nr:hypothetical protein O6H91_Y322300 [Diphasiastrum complanatum]
MAAALTHLRSINFSGHHMVSDVSLEALALRCKDLEELIALDCPFVSDRGLQQVAMLCEKLKTLAIGGTRVTPSGIKIAIGITKSLSSLNLAHLVLNDEVLFQLGDLHVPLRKLVLAGCKGVTSASLLRLVRGCPDLEHLDLEGAHYLSDENMAELAFNIPHVSFLRLNYCSMLTDTSFFCVLQSCKQLRELHMESTGLGWVTASLSSPIPRVHIHKLQLAWNKPVGDSTLKLISKLCPFLLSLDISHCLLVTDHGVAALCRGCLQLRELFLKGCKKVHSMGVSKDEYTSLEDLELESSGFTDAGLVAVSKSCPNLMSLGLEGCVRVTDVGVKQVMEECKALKMMNLKECQGVTLDALAWMVFCRPSLRKLVLPSSGITEGQRARLTRHGCELSRCMTC